MIIKIDNKDKRFYQYMGKFFGSRSIEKQINDRIYDDDKKKWYLYIEGNTVLAFISLQNGVIKNVYCYKDIYLEEIFNYIRNKEKIGISILTKKYIDVYKKCGFNVLDSETYKNFVTIYDNEKVG